MAALSAALKPLQAVTHHLPTFVSDPLVALIGQECYTTLVWNTDFTATDCVRYSISKVLGLGIVLGGSIVKVPQILKIVGGKSARGLSLSSFLLDSISLAITVAYNVRHKFPFSTYGENGFLLVQNVIIIFLILAFSASASKGLYLVAFPLVGAAILGGLFTSFVSLDHLQLLAASCIPLSLSSKLPQIASNYRNGSTGQLSAFLVLNSFAGCVARVFTTSTETKDPVLWWGFFLAAVLNGVLAAQMAWYWKAPLSGGAAKKDRLTTSTRPAAVAEKEKEKVQAHTSIGIGRPTSPPTASGPRTPSGRYTRKLD